MDKEQIIISKTISEKIDRITRDFINPNRIIKYQWIDGVALHRVLSATFQNIWEDTKEMISNN